MSGRIKFNKLRLPRERSGKNSQISQFFKQSCDDTESSNGSKDGIFSSETNLNSPQNKKKKVDQIMGSNLFGTEQDMDLFTGSEISLKNDIPLDVQAPKLVVNPCCSPKNSPIKKIFNNSCSESDFLSPKEQKKITKRKVKINTKKGREKVARKQLKIKNAFMRNEELMSKLITQQSVAESVDPDEMRLALTLSLSEAQSSEMTDSDILSTPLIATPINKKLEKFNYNPDDQGREWGLLPFYSKRKGKLINKFTPLTMRNAEKQEEKVAKKIAQFLNDEYSDTDKLVHLHEKFFVTSGLLNSMQAQTIIIDKHFVETGLIDDYYVSDLFQPSTKKIGCLLRDFRKIPGRSVSPEGIKTLAQVNVRTKSNDTEVVNEQHVLQQNVSSERIMQTDATNKSAEIINPNMLQTEGILEKVVPANLNKSNDKNQDNACLNSNVARDVIRESSPDLFSEFENETEKSTDNAANAFENSIMHANEDKVGVDPENSTELKDECEITIYEKFTSDEDKTTIYEKRSFNFSITPEKINTFIDLTVDEDGNGNQKNVSSGLESHESSKRSSNGRISQESSHSNSSSCIILSDDEVNYSILKADKTLNKRNKNKYIENQYDIRIEKNANLSRKNSNYLLGLAATLTDLLQENEKEYFDKSHDNVKHHKDYFREEAVGHATDSNFSDCWRNPFKTRQILVKERKKENIKNTCEFEIEQNARSSDKKTDTLIDTLLSLPDSLIEDHKNHTEETLNHNRDYNRSYRKETVAQDIHASLHHSWEDVRNIDGTISHNVNIHDEDNLEGIQSLESFTHDQSRDAITSNKSFTHDESLTGIVPLKTFMQNANLDDTLSVKGITHDHNLVAGVSNKSFSYDENRKDIVSIMDLTGDDNPNDALSIESMKHDQNLENMVSKKSLTNLNDLISIEDCTHDDNLEDKLSSKSLTDNENGNYLEHDIDNKNPWGDSIIQRINDDSYKNDASIINNGVEYNRTKDWEDPIFATFKDHKSIALDVDWKDPIIEKVDQFLDDREEKDVTYDLTDSDIDEWKDPVIEAFDNVKYKNNEINSSDCVNSNKSNDWKNPIIEPFDDFKSNNHLNNASINNSTPMYRKRSLEFRKINSDSILLETNLIVGSNLKRYSSTKKFSDFIEDDINYSDLDEIDKLVYGSQELKKDSYKKPSDIDALLTAEIEYVNENSEEEFIQDDVKYKIRTKNIPQKPNYKEMDTTALLRELYKYGLKQLKKKQAVTMLEYIYNQTHPIILEDECNYNKSDKIAENKIKNPVVEHKSEEISKTDSSQELKQFNHFNLKDCSGECLLVNNELTPEIMNEDYIFPTNTRKKIATCLLPFHIAWFNLVKSNNKLREALLCYECVDLQEIFLFLKSIGHRYEPKDMKRFFDNRCIIFRYDLSDGTSNRHVRKTNKLSTKLKQTQS